MGGPGLPPSLSQLEEVYGTRELYAINGAAFQAWLGVEFARLRAVARKGMKQHAHHTTKRERERESESYKHCAAR